MKWIKKLKAKLNKAPFFIKEHWPQYYAMYPDELFEKRFKVHVLVNPLVGEIVELLHEGGFIYYYEVKRISYAKGGDWGPFSNRQFDLQYYGKVKVKKISINF